LEIDNLGRSFFLLKYVGDITLIVSMDFQIAKIILRKLFVSKANVGLSLDAPSLLVGSKSNVNTI
jgi:hypothetical protein